MYCVSQRLATVASPFSGCKSKVGDLKEHMTRFVPGGCGSGRCVEGLLNDFCTTFGYLWVDLGWHCGQVGLQGGTTELLGSTFDMLGIRVGNWKAGCWLLV